MSASANTFFVSQAYLEQNTPLTRNIDAQLIVSTLPVQEKLWLRPILGDDFYSYLLNKYRAQTITAGSAEATLIADYIKPFIAYKAAAACVVLTHLQWTNKGIQQQGQSNGTSVDIPTMKFFRSELLNAADQFGNDLLEYLQDNKDLFPQYTDSDNNDTVDRTNKRFNNGVDFI